MTETKHVLESVGVWGGLLALVPSLIQVMLDFLSVQVSTEELTGVTTSIITGIGGALAIYGRIRARTRLVT